VVPSASVNLRITILVNAKRNKAESPGFSGVPYSSGRVFRRISALGRNSCVATCLIFTDCVAKISGFLASASVYVFRLRDSYLHPHQAEREESGDVSSRLNLGENVLLRTRSNKEMTSQLLFRVRQ
jgi:hypothetical protein